MRDKDDEGVWIRTEVLLAPGYERPTLVKTRRLSGHGAFLEYTGLIVGQSVEIVFPMPYGDGDGYHLVGTVTHRWSDGVWVAFNDNHLATTEMLMRMGPSVSEELSETATPPIPPGRNTHMALPCLPRAIQYRLLPGT